MIVNKYKNGGGSGSGGTYVLPVATANRLGGVKVGSGLSITNDGILSSTASGETYVLPVATDNTLGGIKVGEGLAITNEGVLSSTVSGGTGGIEFSEKMASVGEFIEGSGEGTPIGLVAATDPVEGFYNALELSTDGFPEAHLKSYVIDNSDPSDPQIVEDISVKIATEDDLENLPAYDDTIDGFIGNKVIIAPDQSPAGIGIETAENAWAAIKVDYDDDDNETPYFSRMSLESDGNNVELVEYKHKILLEGDVDNTILKSVSATPENVGKGDVYAYHADKVPVDYGSGWTDSGEYNVMYSRYNDDGNPQAVRLQFDKMEGYGANFRYAINDWDSAVYLQFDSNGISYNNDESSWVATDTGIKFAQPTWMEKTDGATVHVDIYDGYIYFYTDDDTKIWIYGISDNEGSYVEYGTVSPEIAEVNKVYQTTLTYEKEYTVFGVDGEGSYENNIDTNGQFVIHNGGMMYINVINANALSGTTTKVCDLESYGAHASLEYNPTDDEWYFYDFNYENNSTMYTVSYGDTLTAYADDGNNQLQVDFVYGNDGDGHHRLQVSMYEDKAWENWYLPTQDRVIVNLQPIAKKEDLPTKGQLVPTFIDSMYPVLVSRDNQSQWMPYAEFWEMGLRDSMNYNQENGLQFIGRDSYWGYGWKTIDQSMLNPREELPIQVASGTVIAAPEQIVQAGAEVLTSAPMQISTDVYATWNSPTGGTVVSVHNVQAADRVAFHFEGIEGDIHFYCNGSGWDTENLQDVVSDGGYGITGYCYGDGIIITIEADYESAENMPIIRVSTPWEKLYVGNDWGNVRGQFYVSNIPTTTYKNAVMSTNIKNMVKIYQSDYQTLVNQGVADPDTFYVIMEDLPPA